MSAPRKNLSPAARPRRVSRSILAGALAAACLLPHNFQKNPLAAAPEAVASPAAAADRPAPPRAEGAGPGRLFYTPERRQLLERQRATNRPAERKVETRQMSLDGMVRRSGGKQTVWINGRPYTEREAGIVQATPDASRPGRARVAIPNEGGYDLAVGSSVNRDTGEVRSPLGGGRVVRSGSR